MKRLFKKIINLILCSVSILFLVCGCGTEEKNYTGEKVRVHNEFEATLTEFYVPIHLDNYTFLNKEGQEEVKTFEKYEYLYKVDVCICKIKNINKETIIDNDDFKLFLNGNKAKLIEDYNYIGKPITANPTTFTFYFVSSKNVELPSSRSYLEIDFYATKIGKNIYLEKN